MRNANLDGVFASEVEMRGADLSNVDFRDADLRSASLVRAQMTETMLEGADLSGADLRLVKFEMTQANAATKWPDGFDPVASPEIVIDD
jgi:uncharacterized protein YjbI with pentapeptide repeats